MALIPSTLTLAKVEEQLRNLKLGEDAALKAQSAGIDVSEQLRKIKDLRNNLLKIKQAYFPGQ